MITYVEGNIFSSPAQVIVNTVNTVGVMGKGIALEYKNRYPDMFARYREYCDTKQLVIGRLMLWYAPDHWILSFPTKMHWRNPSKLDYIEQGLKKFVDTYAQKQIVSIAFPRLGCGNGELLWEDVRPLMETYLSPLPIDVYIYVKGDGDLSKPEHTRQDETAIWLREHARDMSFRGVKDDILHSRKDLFHPYRFEFQNHTWTVEWDTQCKFSQEDGHNSVSVSEDTFRSMWEEMRESAIFPRLSDDDSINLVYALLNSLGYTSEVRILDKQTDSFVDGYQLNEGMGRTFALMAG